MGISVGCDKSEYKDINIINMFRTNFYWMYNYLSKIKTNDTPAFNAYLILCMLHFFNIATIVIVLCYLLGINMKTSSKNPVYVVVGLVACLSIVEYFVFYSKREAIINECKTMSKDKRNKSLILFWIYVIVSYSSVFIVGFNLAS